MKVDDCGWNWCSGWTWMKVHESGWNQKKVYESGWSLGDHLLTICWPLVDHLMTTFDYLVTSQWPLIDHLVTTWWLFGDYLVTIWWPFGDHFISYSSLLPQFFTLWPLGDSSAHLYNFFFCTSKHRPSSSLWSLLILSSILSWSIFFWKLWAICTQ